mmetsp:Transcript_8760/g.39772  ORF Transcript_8760/g.39772 Transcript_8760/m.39772 type:complete len:200 (+) Transcript_8760:999-1598(+)
MSSCSSRSIITTRHLLRLDPRSMEASSREASLSNAARAEPYPASSLAGDRTRDGLSGEETFPKAATRRCAPWLYCAPDLARSTAFRHSLVSESVVFPLELPPEFSSFSLSADASTLSAVLLLAKPLNLNGLNRTGPGDSSIDDSRSLSRASSMSSMVLSPMARGNLLSLSDSNSSSSDSSSYIFVAFFATDDGRLMTVF